jgi:pullulanase
VGIIRGWNGAIAQMIYKKLIAIRRAHPALRSQNFYPNPYDERKTLFNDLGYGVNQEKDVAIFHRWGNDAQGRLERFIIVLNCSEYEQVVDVPFPDSGRWEDLLNGGTIQANDYWLCGERLSSHWGRVYFKLD